MNIKVVLSFWNKGKTEEEAEGVKGRTEGEGGKQGGDGRPVDA